MTGHEEMTSWTLDMLRLHGHNVKNNNNDNNNNK